MEELKKYLKALTLLQLQTQLGRGFVKPEVLLARAGLTHKEIAELLGKSQMAVSKAISRGKANQAEEEDPADE